METTYSAFAGTRRLATGPLTEVLRTVWPHREVPGLLLFDHTTGRQVDFDWRGSADDVVARTLPPPAKSGPGRPKLGVVSTEVTLLPRHWDWLNAQASRASGTLRRLVEEAMAREASDPKKRLEALGQVLWALAGNEPGFEDASRALFAGDRIRLEALAARWSGDLPAFVKAWS
jgi:hypothetical protein